ncbi:MAG: hypothetical protein DME04_05270 [Candidatus Rokuibacteriota bacterium]|nr:MAG: hypothetical protein DME04_05270 [Candidatus Rokubacteria bacterium]
MQMDLWFDLAVRGEPDVQAALLRRLELAEPAGPPADPTPDAEPDAEAEARPQPPPRAVIA